MAVYQFLNFIFTYFSIILNLKFNYQLLFTSRYYFILFSPFQYFFLSIFINYLINFRFLNYLIVIIISENPLDIFDSNFKNCFN